VKNVLNKTMRSNKWTIKYIFILGFYF
jgi:hypothetical protein